MSQTLSQTAHHKKKARTQVCLTQQEIIDKYNKDHQQSWETQSEGTQERFIESLVDWLTDLSSTWDAPSDVEQSDKEEMSQGGHTGGRNTPTQSTSILPTSPAPTLDDLTRIVMDLGIAVRHLSMQMRTLTQQVMLAMSMHP